MKISNQTNPFDILIQNLVQEVNGFLIAIDQTKLGFASRFNEALQKLLTEINNQQKQNENSEIKDGPI